jgi:hypothetical protein
MAIHLEEWGVKYEELSGQPVLPNFQNSYLCVVNSNHSFSSIQQILYVGFALLTLVATKSSIFWDKAPCSLVKVNKCFERENACCLLHSDFLIDLLFDPEDGGYMFLQDIGRFSPGYRMLYPKTQYSSIQQILLSHAIHKKCEYLISFLLLTSN